MSRSDQNYTDLIADARVWPRDGVSKGPLINALADAIEALVKERDQAIRDLDAGFAESDHLSAKYYQRMRAAEKHARMRASESADLERERDELAAVIEDALAFCREQHDSIRGQFDQTGGAPAEYIGFANACGDVVGILSAYTKGTDRD